VPALTRIGGVLVQLVEIPGLIAGASDDRGGGRPLLGVLRSADAIVYCMRGNGDPAELETVRNEVAAAEIEKPSFIAATRADEATDADLAGLRERFPEAEILPVSVLDDASLDELRDRIWRLTGLIRVYLRKDGDVAEEPLALTPPATVLDVADAVHHNLAASFTAARLWGPSARFDGQRVGRDQPVQDTDVVEILTAI
jgi:ribosome-interacting GTPase 1